MSDLLSIGASGVRAYQTALTTVSDNIANAGTAGYAKRTTDLKQVASTGGLTTGAALTGNGVRVDTIGRSADAYRAAAVRSSGADLARTETGAVWLGRIEGAMSGDKLADRLTSFFNAGKTLAADPTSSASRTVMLEAATSVAASFAATGRALDQAQSDLDDQAQGAVATLDSLGVALAKTNDGLGRTQPGTAGAAALMDQRDQLLEQLSAVVDVNAQFDAAGRATVRLGGSSGPVFVALGEAGTAAYTRNDEGAVSFSVTRAGTDSTIASSGGALAGIADGAQKIADAKAALGAIATGFTTTVNAVQAQGRDLNGQAGQPVFATGERATDISVSFTDPSGIAAASATGGKRDASNLAALADARVTGGFEADTTALVAGNAATLQQRKVVAEAQGAIHDAAVASRDAVSGVDLDTEAVDLLRFQQAYQASSRVIQVARETFQSILEIR